MYPADRTLVVTASVALSTVLGSVHAFSVFVAEWESFPGVKRAEISLVYSIALVSLTLAVLFGHRIYRLCAPATIFLLSGVGAALGLALSASSSSLFILYLSYGVLFGGANGLGYGYALQLAGQAMPHRRALCMSLVTAFYAVGASTAPLLFVMMINRGGNKLALISASLILFAVSTVAAVAIRRSGVRYQGESPTAIAPLSPDQRRTRLLLWLGFGSAVTAGLMVIGHAFGVASWLNHGSETAAWSPSVIAVGSMAGGFAAGYSADRLSARPLLCWLAAFTVIGLLLLLKPVGSSWALAVTGFGLVGFSYGAIIAIVPVAVANQYGEQASARIYGQIFTAWGLAGLVGPWVGGRVFDQSASYNLSILIAVALSGCALLAFHLGLRDQSN